MHLEARTIRFWVFAILMIGLGNPDMSWGAEGSKPASVPQEPGGTAAVADTFGYVLVPLRDLKSPEKVTDEERKSHSPTWWSSLPSLFAAIAWPLAAIYLVSRLLRAPQIEVLLNKLYRRTSQISIAGLEIKLSDGAEATIDDLKTLIAKVPATHQQWVNNTHLTEQFRKVISDLKIYMCEPNEEFKRAIANSDQFSKLRFTLHVPDIVFTYSVRQLVNYLGRGRGGAGRLFSVRRGIIGLAWRLEKSQYQSSAFSVDQLVEIWGMTQTEAIDTSSESALFLTFVLKNDQGLPIGLLYADGKLPNLLNAVAVSPHSTESALALIDTKVGEFSRTRGLIQSLVNLEEARVNVSQVDIYNINAG